MFHPDAPIDTIIKKYATWKKDKKMFIVENPLPPSIEGLNADNFRINL